LLPEKLHQHAFSSNKTKIIGGERMMTHQQASDMVRIHSLFFNSTDKLILSLSYDEEDGHQQ